MIVTDQRGRITILTIDRADKHNALNRAILSELDEILEQIIDTRRAQAVVLTGAGERAFSAGADLSELTGLSVHAATEVVRAGQRTLRRIETSPIPVIAAVDGVALGGGFELMLATTFPVLAESAQLGLPEAGLGLIPGYGGTQRLTRAIGMHAARYTMLTGERITAERAYTLGITPVAPVPDGTAVEAATMIAKQITQRGPDAVRAILDATRMAYEAPVDTGFAYEATRAGNAIASAEAAEGVAAFLGKRAARFTMPGEVAPDETSAP